MFVSVELKTIKLEDHDTLQLYVGPGQHSVFVSGYGKITITSNGGHGVTFVIDVYEAIKQAHNTIKDINPT